MIAFLGAVGRLGLGFERGLDAAGGMMGGLVFHFPSSQQET